MGRRHLHRSAGGAVRVKNFLVEDQPMLSPAQTMTATPSPVLISYQ